MESSKCLTDPKERKKRGKREDGINRKQIARLEVNLTQSITLNIKGLISPIKRQRRPDCMKSKARQYATYKKITY